MGRGAGTIMTPQNFDPEYDALMRQIAREERAEVEGRLSRAREMRRSSERLELDCRAQQLRATLRIAASREVKSRACDLIEQAERLIQTGHSQSDKP
jgi:malonyl CoA-acyl carrier protein transacylase